MKKHNTLMGQVLNPEAITEKLTKRINEWLKGWSDWPDPSMVRDWKRGASPSYLKQILADEGWCNLSDNLDFEIMLHKAGFVLIPAKLKNGENHKSVRIVWPID